MTNPSIAQLLTILQEHYNPRETGWLWLAVYRDADVSGVVNQIEGAYDELPGFAEPLARVITGCGAEKAHLALCRPGGRPYEVDRELWRGLRQLVSPELLVDLVVFDRHEHWSMREEDAVAA
jgi:hypothetical protein